MKVTQPVPIYHLQERTTENFEVIRLSRDQDFAHMSEAHRDNNYLFLFQEKGCTQFMVDFQEITIQGSAIFCLIPGQIHYGISSQKTSLWAIAIDAAWIKGAFRTIVLEFAIRKAPVFMEAPESVLLGNSLVLLQQLVKQKYTEIQHQTIHSMLDVCLGLFMSSCQSGEQQLPQLNLRPVTITRQFRSLLLVSFRQMKSPAEYAAALNISPAYLNEVVKNTTGCPVSYWIHQEIILEAKRMLFYTDSTVKEIAVNLGYTDVTYFIRLFGKVAGLAPLKFRNKYRE